jgi:ABC-type amino acid transport substrate-binding protein
MSGEVMARFIIASLLTLYSSLSFCCDESAAKSFLAKLKWQTEDYPPYNYLNSSDELVGIFPEILTLIYNKLEIKLNTQNIAVVPWARLLQSVKRYPDYAAFSMVTTMKRAQTYQLVPLPVVTKISIMVLNQNKGAINSKKVDELNIAVVRGDIGQDLLNSQNISAAQIETTSAFSMLQMLIHQRVDAIAYSEDVTYFQLEKLDLKNNAITPIYSLSDQSFVNYAFHKSTPDCVINMFENTITKLNEERKLKSVWQKHFNSNNG